RSVTARGCSACSWGSAPSRSHSWTPSCASAAGSGSCCWASIGPRSLAGTSRCSVRLRAMERARRHQRFSSALAFALLALAAELLGRSLAHRIDLGRHVSSPSYSGADYYPFLLMAVKLGVALLAARLAWRFVRARSAAHAGRRVLTTLGKDPGRAPRVRLKLSPRLWLAAFIVTSLFALVHVDVEQAASGRWPLLWPWLHTSTL